MIKKYICETKECSEIYTKEQYHGKGKGWLLGFICDKCGWHCKLLEVEK